MRKCYAELIERQAREIAPDIDVEVTKPGYPDFDLWGYEVLVEGKPVPFAAWEDMRTYLSATR